MPPFWKQLFSQVIPYPRNGHFYHILEDWLPGWSEMSANLLSKSCLAWGTRWKKVLWANIPSLKIQQQNLFLHPQFFVRDAFKIIYASHFGTDSQINQFLKVMNFLVNYNTLLFGKICPPTLSKSNNHNHDLETTLSSSSSSWSNPARHFSLPAQEWREFQNCDWAQILVKKKVSIGQLFF